MPIKNQKSKIKNAPPLRVAFVTTNLGIGGAERLLCEMITRLDRARFEPVLVCLKQRMSLGTRLAGQGVRVYCDLSRGRFDLRVIERLATVFRKERVQVVCTVGTGGDRSFWGRLAARWAGVPVVISCPHSMGVPDKFEPSNRLLSGITDAFIAVAHKQKSYLVKSEGCPASKIHVIHNGVDLDRFTPASADPGQRASLGIPPDAPLAGLVAYLRPEKNIETFIQAAALVHERLPNAHFVIVGDGPERKKLESLARSLGVTQVVHFSGLCQDVREWVRAMDVVGLTSICEAFPVSLLEAMACGKPVVATKVGAIPEMIVSGETGFLVGPRDSAGVAEAIYQVLSDPTNSHAMGRRARQHVENHFSLESMVRGYERLFVRLLENKHRAVPPGIARQERVPALKQAKRQNPTPAATSSRSNWLPGLASLTTTACGLG